MKAESIHALLSFAGAENYSYSYIDGTAIFTAKAGRHPIKGMIKIFNISGSTVMYTVDGTCYKFCNGTLQRSESDIQSLSIRITNVPRQVFDDVVATNLRLLPKEYLTKGVLTGFCSGKVFVKGVLAFEDERLHYGYNFDSFPTDLQEATGKLLSALPADVLRAVCRYWDAEKVIVFNRKFLDTFLRKAL